MDFPRPDHPVPDDSDLESLGAELDRGLRREAHRERPVLTLLELGRDLAGSLDEREQSRVGLLTLMGHAATSRAALWVRDEDAPGVLHLVEAHGIPSGHCDLLGRALVRVIPQLEARRGPALLPIERLEEFVDAVSRAALHESRVESLGLLRTGDQVLGVVTLGAPVGGTLRSGLDRHVLEAACGMLAVSLANARLFARVRRHGEALERANRELAELDRLKGEFIANVNHELRTPIAVIVGATSCLRTGGLERADAGRFVEMIHLHASRLGGMVQSLLDFDSLHSRNVEVAVRPLDLAAVAGTYHRSRRRKVEEEGRTFTFEADAPALPALGDDKRVAEILERVVDNARRFTPTGTRIHLGVRAEERDGRRWAVAEVTDDGPGIARESLARIFDPFRQVDGSATRAVGGLGLGLAAARAFAEAMDGRLEAESEPGLGATFRLLLPAA